VTGTKGDVLLVMVAASLAAHAVASSRSMKISANIRASLGEAPVMDPMFPCRCDGHHRKRTAPNKPRPKAGLFLACQSNRSWGSAMREHGLQYGRMDIASEP
jgi:hypothetical protein